MTLQLTTRLSQNQQATAAADPAQTDDKAITDSAEQLAPGQPADILADRNKDTDEDGIPDSRERGTGYGSRKCRFGR
ncbi:MAG: hypothetical protein R3E95_10025 [Thiolinea sp.]